MNRLDNYGEILTVRQVAKLLGIARNSVYQAAAAGEIPSVRVGRRILFARRSLEVWLSSGTGDTQRPWQPTRGAREVLPVRPRGWRGERPQNRLRRPGRGSLRRPNHEF
ncbi:MAG: helix-turn-helix domain-containing protein [Chloroflexi bacterium]|nr:helix-turn-helix domain-containing protein [Chloroflexota bacterium]